MRVPTYGGPQVTEQPRPGGYQDASDYTGAARAAGSVAAQVDGMAQKVIEAQNQDFAWRADAKMKTDFAAWEAQTKPKFVGAAAGGMNDPTTGLPTGTYAEQVQKYWAGASSAFGAQLNPDQQRIIDRNVALYSANTVGDATRYVTGELTKSHLEAFTTAKDADIQGALHAGTPAAAEIAADGIRQKNAQFAVQQGHVDPATGMADTNWLAAANTADLTKLHANMIGQLQQTSTDAARQYLTAHKSEIDGTKLDDIEKALTTAEASTKAVQAVSDVFTKYLPAGADPSHGETPLNVTGMMADVEAQFKGNPQGLSAARAELSARVQAWKTTESQFQTDAINTIEAGVAQGRGLPWAMQQPQWATLSGKSQAAITDHLESKANAALGRANAMDARADAADARADRRLGREHYDLYLQASDPATLSQLTPEQVRAYLPTLGTTLTHSLMEQRQRLTNATDTRKATMDADAFATLARDSFGMKDPHDPSASKEDKAAFVYTRENVNFVLQQEQAAKKLPLTPDEKASIMQREMARTVTVNPGWFTSNKQVPVVGLTAKQLEEVEIPDAERPKLAAALDAMRKARPNDPRFAPTDANMRTLYVRGVSPAGNRFNGQ